MKQTDLKDHIIKSRIKPLQDTETKVKVNDASVSFGKPQQQILKPGNLQYNTAKVHFPLGPPRKSLSFKVNPGLWDLFKCRVKEQGLSICHVLECLIASYLTAEATVEPKVHQSVTVVQNLYFDRYVYKPRRVYRRRGESVDRTIRVEKCGSSGECGVCGSVKVVGREHFWKDSDHNRECVETWVCQSCHERNRRRGLVHGFRRVDSI